MSKIAMYYHGGSGNHGCEAIVRATQKILGQKISLYTSCPDEDNRYELNNIVNIIEDKETPLKRNSVDFFKAAVSHKLKKDDFKYICLSHKPFFDDVVKGDIYLSIGGDNYCYKGRDILGYYNKQLHKKGAKTVLWGCSFDPDDMTDAIALDLKQYDLIVAREGISYETLKKVNDNTVLLPDPAFQLDVEEYPLPNGFKEGHTVGINISPLVMEYAKGNVILENYRELIRYIISETDEMVLLIPHVVKENNDDGTVIELLYNEFRDTGRVIKAEDMNCMRLKGFISKCRFFIGARTHATIAAYSTCVPTLVVGYSVKSTGIARELFKKDENYVVPVQGMNNAGDLTGCFKWLVNNEEKIREHLGVFIPEYVSRVLCARSLIEDLQT